MGKSRKQLNPRMIVINLFKKLQSQYPELKHTKLRFTSTRQKITNKKVCGCYCPNINCIYIITDSPNWWFNDSITLVHEVAHAIVCNRNIDNPKEDHGPEWQRIASELCLPRDDIFWSSERRITRNQKSNVLNKNFYSCNNDTCDSRKFLEKYKLLQR